MFIQNSLERRSILMGLKYIDVQNDNTTKTGNITKEVILMDEDLKAHVNAEQSQTRYTTDPDNSETNDMYKHKENIKVLLENSNATMIKGFGRVGYSCCFCDEKNKIPSKLKQHNLEAHNDVGDEAIKVKQISDLICKVDITDLKCKLCNKSIDTLEEIMNHLSKKHLKLIHTDVKNHIIPFKFDTDSLECVICTKDFKHFKLLSEHMSEHYRNYECSLCDRVFVNKQAMYTHRYRHVKGTFKCAHCSKVFDTRSKKSVHERTVHKYGSKTRKCEFCDERFSTKLLVQAHELKFHSGIKPKINQNFKPKLEPSITTFRKKPNILRSRTGPGEKSKRNQNSGKLLETNILSNGNKEDRKNVIDYDHEKSDKNISKPQDKERKATKKVPTLQKEKPEKNEVYDMHKHKYNIKTILQNTNATIIRGHGRYGYSCCFCDQQKEIPSELKQHNLEAHSNDADEAIKVKYVSDLIIRLDITDLKCKLCNKNINTLEELIVHLTKTHSKYIYTDVKNHTIPFKFDTDSLQCVMCKRDFKYFKLLSEHMSDHYRNYECPNCDRAFINKQSMQTHSYRHKSGIFKCSHCPKVFDTRPKRCNHEKVIHALAGKPRKCTYCDERFSTLDSLHTHEIKFHGVKPRIFSCQACNKSYKSQSALITHRKRYHLMLRPHECPDCDMAFFSKLELNIHSVTHTKSRNLQCELCNKSFGTKCCLRQHMRVHSSERRYKCEICERGFAYRSTWKVHMRGRHGKIV